MLASFPSELWLNPSQYAFMSSESSGIMVKVVFFVLVGWIGRAVYKRVHAKVDAHLECHVEGCSNHGHIVHGTPYRACHDHDPRITHQLGEAITAEHIARAVAQAQP